jgi:hypothetical protein
MAGGTQPERRQPPVVDPRSEVARSGSRSLGMLAIGLLIAVGLVVVIWVAVTWWGLWQTGEG